MEPQQLIRAAMAARENAYAPYTGFTVGAALLCADGTVAEGCNVENAALCPGSCAERTALYAAVAKGYRRFTAIAVVGGESFCPPCGVCRQALSEFCGDDFLIHLAPPGRPDDIQSFTLGELLPHSFGPGQGLTQTGEPG